METVSRICLSVILLTSAIESQGIKYAEVGGSTVLKPKPFSFSAPLEFCQWRKNEDKVAEFDTSFSNEVDYYGVYKERTTLLLKDEGLRKTGDLSLTSLQMSDSGVYSVRFVNNDESKQIVADLKVILDAPTPKVTATCDDPVSSCTLTCAANTTGAEPVERRWKKDGEEFADMNGAISVIITQADSTTKEYTCEMKNPVSEQKNIDYSWKTSAPFKNPFHSDGLPTAAQAVIGVVVILVILVVLLVVAVVGLSAFDKHNPGKLPAPISSAVTAIERRRQNRTAKPPAEPTVSEAMIPAPGQPKEAAAEEN